MTSPVDPRVWLPAVRAGSGADVFTSRLADSLRSRGIPAVITWFPHWCELSPDLMRLVRPPSDINVIHANSAYAFAFRRKGLPLVATEHHYLLDPGYRPYKSFPQQLYHRLLIGPFLRRSYAAADAITAVSNFTAGVLKREANRTDARPIPLWVDYDVFSPAKHGAKKDHRFRLLFVGNISRRKGGDVIPLLARQLGTDFEIRCTSGLRTDRRESGVDNVTVLGRLSEAQLVEEYRSCDAVLVPSRYEGFGYAALEAMACGKPVVGYRCGAVADVVSDGKTGLLCDVDDLKMLTLNCQRLARNPAEVEAFGVAGRQRATTTFSEESAVNAYIALYGELIDRQTHLS